MSPRRFRPRRIGRRIARRALRRGRRRFFRRRARRFLLGGAVLLALSNTHRAYKFREEDVDSLEKHYGKPAEELSEEEIDQGMRNLGIKDIELDDTDKAKIYHADKQDSNLKDRAQKYCIYCGELLEKGASYCHNCGAKV
ncbi:MAG: hypothetical protein U9O98_08115 [Asgard group archaeon]|nr:hypothetical protein [Asgard group archaeon]